MSVPPGQSKDIGPIPQVPSLTYPVNKNVDRIRNADDQIGDFSRSEIDRHGSLMFSSMKDERGEPILGVILSRLRERGSIAVMDAGCGTGHTLYEIRDQLLFRGGVTPDKILTVGVNDKDFSDESANLLVREAISKGDIKYVVAKLETVDLQPESFDFITSHEVLTHSDPVKVVSIIERLLPALKQNGALVFDITEQQQEDPNIQVYLEWRVQQAGYSVFEYTRENRFKEKRVFVWIKPKANRPK